jgi:predicted ATP-dependent serine protease
VALQPSTAGWLGSAAAQSQATERFTRLRDVTASRAPRFSTGSAELNRLLNGGLVAGSVTLACGSPGVGKSTLLLQLAALLCEHRVGGGRPYADVFAGKAALGQAAGGRAGGGKVGKAAAAAAAKLAPAHLLGGGGGRAVAYVSGEESAEQIRERARRLGVGDMDLWLLNETCVDTMLERLGEVQAAQAAEAAAAAAAAAEESAGQSSVDEGEGEGEEGAAAEGAAGVRAAGRPPPSKSCSPPPAPAGAGGLACIIVDSIQTMWTSAFPGNQAGTVTQVRESSVRLLQYAKATGVPVLLVGHVTKAGDIAGPRVLEHVVDTVLFMENDESSAAMAGYPSASAAGPASAGAGGGGGFGAASGAAAAGFASNGAGVGGGSGASSGYRILRCLKNRFGPTADIALLEMTDGGFREADPARLFLSPEVLQHPSDGADGAEADGPGTSAAALERRAGGSSPAKGGSASGRCVTAAMEGSRALLIEMQALVYPSFFAYPRQRSMGYSQDRLTMILALLNRYPRIRPRYTDVLTNVVGGLRLTDTGADLALAIALASCFLGQAPAERSLFVGELGLTGEVRQVPALDARLAAARKLGFREGVVPSSPQTRRTAAQQHARGSGAPVTEGGGAGEGPPAAAPALSLAPAGPAVSSAAASGPASFLRVVPVSTLGQALVHAFGIGAISGSPDAARFQAAAAAYGSSSSNSSEASGSAGGRPGFARRSTGADVGGYRRGGAITAPLTPPAPAYAGEGQPVQARGDGTAFEARGGDADVADDGDFDAPVSGDVNDDGGVAGAALRNEWRG